MLVTRGTASAGGTLPADVSGVRVDGQDVFVSSIRRVPANGDGHGAGDGIEVRLAALSDTGSTARLTGDFTEATTVDLLGRPLSTTPAQDGLELALAPWEIRTVVLRQHPTAPASRP